jgi:hypothetical protein
VVETIIELLTNSWAPPKREGLLWDIFVVVYNASRRRELAGWLMLRWWGSSFNVNKLWKRRWGDVPWILNDTWKLVAAAIDNRLSPISPSSFCINHRKFSLYSMLLPSVPQVSLSLSLLFHLLLFFSDSTILSSLLHTALCDGITVSYTTTAGLYCALSS